MEEDEVLSLNRPESCLTNPPGHLWRDEWTALSGELSSLLPSDSKGVLKHGEVFLGDADSSRLGQLVIPYRAQTARQVPVQGVGFGIWVPIHWDLGACPGCEICDFGQLDISYRSQTARWVPVQGEGFRIWVPIQRGRI